jgi:hypothetical protein
LLLVLSVLLCFSSYSSNAQVTCSTDGTTNPLAGNGTCLDPNDNTVQEIIDQGDFGTGSHSTGSSHNQMYQMTNRMTGAVTSTDYIMHFSYTDDTWVTNMAINQALVGAGFDIAGYSAEWQWKNETTNTINGACTATKVNGDCLDDLVITVDAFASGTNIYSEEWDYSQTKSNGYTVEEVLSFAPLALVPGVTIDQIEVTIRGKDNGYWQGMHGPKVMNFTGSVVLMPDTCTLNGTLSDASCPGYAAALFQQQCTANPLFDSSCSGYAAAYLIQQCTANPLHDPSCTGYQQAYLYAQCKLNPLYDTTCTGYQQAYLLQQCNLDPLYDSTCTGHLTAQCNIDPLYDPACTGYADAYLLQQCDFDPLYDVQCTGYQQAFFNQQCEMDGQFDSSCPNFVAALEEILDDGTTVDPIADALAAPEIDLTVAIPEVPVVVVTEIPIVEETVSAEYEQTQGDMMAMEDDIEREIAELERESEENNEEEDVSNPFEKEREEKEIVEVETLPGDSDGEVGTGEAVQEDDIEKEIAALESEAEAPTEKKQKKVVTKNDKIRLLLAKKAIELTKQVENAVTIEQQMLVQRQLLALLSFVPGFDYAEKELNQVSFYPPKPVVDHQYARWFLNDPNFGIMEDSQYNFK